MTVAEAGSIDPVVAFPDEPLYVALTKMLERDVGRLPVVDRNNPGFVVGYLGRAAILSARMKFHEEENIRQRGSFSGTTHAQD
jgi:CBS domain-containing protein